jgi:opacity protein-like surface antigen
VASYAGPDFGGFTDHLDAEGFDISYIVGWAPGSQTRFAIFGTVGVFAWDQDVLYRDASGVYPFQDEGTSFSMGLGTEFKLTDEFGIHLEYQLFKDVGDDGLGGSGHEYDRDVISLGVAYRFGRPRE